MKNQIKVFRARFDMTQEELAAKIGVVRQTILAIENGKYVPPPRARLPDRAAVQSHRRGGVPV